MGNEIGGAAWASSVRGIGEIQNGHRSGSGFFVLVLAEFKLAMAAEQRYEDLKRAGGTALARDAIVPADIPRRIFEEFYHSEGLWSRDAEPPARLMACDDRSA